MRHRTGVALVTALAMTAVAALVLGLMVVNRPRVPQSSAASESARSPTPEPRRSSPQLPNDGWFIAAPDGMAMRANELIDDPDMLALYLDETQAEAIVDSGFRRVRMRSYYAGASGGGAFKVMEVDEPAELLGRLRRTGSGRGERYPDLPQAHMRSQVVQMESTRAHDVFAHFRTVTFLSAPYVVEIEAYAINADVAQHRVETYARAQHELLQSRPD
jgi:hypothetical protein